MEQIYNPIKDLRQAVFNLIYVKHIYFSDAPKRICSKKLISYYKDHFDELFLIPKMEELQSFKKRSKDIVFDSWHLYSRDTYWHYLPKELNRDEFFTRLICNIISEIYRKYGLTKENVDRLLKCSFLFLNNKKIAGIFNKDISYRLLTEKKGSGLYIQYIFQNCRNQFSENELIEIMKTDYFKSTRCILGGSQTVREASINNMLCWQNITPKVLNYLFNEILFDDEYLLQKEINYIFKIKRKIFESKGITKENLEDKARLLLECL